MTTTTTTSTDLTQTVRLGLARATFALLDGDDRLADLALRNDDVFRSAPAEGEVAGVSTANLKRIGASTVELASVARKRAPKQAVPDRLHPVIRAMAREADAMIEAAVAGRPVEASAMNRHVDVLLGRVQSESWPHGTKAARRAMNLSQAYADIADCAVAMSGARSGTQSATDERRVA